MAPSSQGPKRRRLTDRASNIQSQAPASSQRDNDKRYYDPDQDENERRRTRKSYRDLAGDFNGTRRVSHLCVYSNREQARSNQFPSTDSRAEYLQSGNDGIYRTVVKANRLFENVKQTSDATIDSRLLVNAADLSHKKTARLALGDTNVGIDVDEFVSKCISFMRRGPDVSSDLPSSTQNRRRHRQTQREVDSDDEDQGDAMNWDWLGRTACLPKNARPSVTGFLLGPLSVQKRTRQVTQRINREAPDATQAVQPRTLEQEDLDQREDSNLTEMCSKINKLLSEWQAKAQNAADAEINQVEDCTEEMARKIIDKHVIADDGGVPLFRFCINSKSFGQSVENLFYVSFLVRDGTVGLAVDQQGLPTLRKSNNPLRAPSYSSSVVLY